MGTTGTDARMTHTTTSSKGTTQMKNSAQSAVSSSTAMPVVNSSGDGQGRAAERAEMVVHKRCGGQAWIVFASRYFPEVDREFEITACTKCGTTEMARPTIPADRIAAYEYEMRTGNRIMTDTQREFAQMDWSIELNARVEHQKTVDAYRSPSVVFDPYCDDY